MDVAEVPAECGPQDAGVATPDEWKGLIRRQAGFFSFDPDTRHCCMITVLAPWLDTPGPTWQLVAAMLRNQRRELEQRPPAPPGQQRPTFAWRPRCLEASVASECASTDRGLSNQAGVITFGKRVLGFATSRKGSFGRPLSGKIGAQAGMPGRDPKADMTRRRSPSGELGD